MHEEHHHRGNTAHAEGADAELALAAGDPERRLVLVLLRVLPDQELPIGNCEVQLGEEACPAR